MHKRVLVLITMASLIAAAGGISFGIKATSAQKAAQNEAQALRNQLDDQKTSPSPTNTAPLVAIKELASMGTNDVASLQEQIAARDAELARLRAELENRSNTGQPRQSFQERMAQLKEEDPERYAEMIQRRTERQQQMRYDQANRLATVVNMDTSGMTEEELANHNALVEKLSAIWEQTGTFDPENPPDRETMRDLFGSMREIGEMMDQERSVIFRQLGNEVGLSGQEATDFAAYVQSIIDATTMRSPMRGDRGQRGAGRDGGNSGGGN